MCRTDQLRKGYKSMRHISNVATFFLALLAAGSSHAQGVSITEQLRGISLTNLGGFISPIYGTGVVETWSWVDGRQVVRVLVFQETGQGVLITSRPKFRTGVTFQAGCGTELMVIDGWGEVEMYSSDPDQRNRLAERAGTWETDQKDVTITKLQDGTMEFWIESVAGSIPVRGFVPTPCAAIK